LPYIDEHVTSVPADRAHTWSALVRVWCSDPTDLSSVRTDFFALDEAEPPRRLALQGRHPFVVYKLVFELHTDGPQRTRLHAVTWAEFQELRATPIARWSSEPAHTASPCG